MGATIDWAKALRGEDEPLVKLLSSRKLIEEIVANLPAEAIEPQAIFDTCSERLKQYLIDGKSEFEVAGWINLYFELCRLGRVPAREVDVFPVERLLALCNAKDSSTFQKTILLDKAKGDDDPLWKNWGAAMDSWDAFFKDRKVSETNLGQTVIMHLAEMALGHYAKEKTIKGRGILTLLIVPLLRAIYGSPDRAHLLYSAYHAGGAGTGGAFDALYAKELGVIEEFRDRFMRRRDELFCAIKRDVESAGENLRELSEELKRTVNEIIHGEGGEGKPTRVAQLTCLIRALDLSDHIDSFKYLNHLGGVEYKRIDGNDAPGDVRWGAVEPAKVQEFKKCIDREFSAGHRIEFLERVFEDAGGNASWVQDGEISFYWLFDAAFDGRLNARFLREELCLFVDEVPTPKLWAFLNFLHRVAVSGRPKHYGSEPWKAPIEFLYQGFLNEGMNDVDSVVKLFVEAYGKLRAGGIVSVGALRDKARIETYRLETILRTGQPYPYTLFFYPVTFVKVADDKVVPGVFLGGTFGALESAWFPSVIARQNYHLASCVGAIRPLIDHEVGRVLSDDQHRFLAQNRQRTFRLVEPAVKRLTQLFRDAQFAAFEIESAVDLNWSGMFEPALLQVCEQLFAGTGPLEIEGSTDGHGKTLVFLRKHEITGGLENLKMGLLYLALGGCGERRPRKDQNFTLDRLQALVSEARPFASNEFMDAFNARANSFTNATDHKDVAAHLALLKVLAVDCAENARSVHVAQLAAALSLVCGDGAERAGTVRIKDGVDFRGAFYPKQQGGLASLSDLIKSDAGFPNGGPLTFSTGELKSSAALAGEIEPHRFLRALRVLSEEVMAYSRRNADRVFVGEWSVEVVTPKMGVPRCIDVIIKCKNRFSIETKAAILGQIESEDVSYHNLRSNFKLIAQGIGCRPKFFDAMTPVAPVLSDVSRFIIIDGAADGKESCEIKFRIGMPGVLPSNGGSGA